ncbi:MAG: DUF4296 domain-containing protein [Bacteroidales bacterium]|nr:DUF4296 domain-containing protein [Bacteroidales bacterium]
MRRFLLFGALALVLLASCSSKKTIEAPEPLLSEQQMIDVLTDSYLIEAMLNQKKSNGENVTSLQSVYYDQLMEHYGITDSIFDANMEYYSHDLVTLERIMDSVNNRFLNAQQEE